MGNQQLTSICYLSHEGSFHGKLYLGFSLKGKEGYFGTFSDKEFQPTSRLILYRGNPYVALLLEWGYQNCWNTSLNPRFANQKLQSYGLQCKLILETKQGGNLHEVKTREKISLTMKTKKLGTHNPEVRKAGNKANRGRKRTPEQKIRIQAGTYYGILKKGVWPKSGRVLTPSEVKRLTEYIEEAQRLGIYTVPSSEGKHGTA